MKSLEDLFRQSSKQRQETGKLLALDPGGTTGYAIFENAQFVEAGQFRGSYDVLLPFLEHHRPDVIIFEDFQLFPWLAKSQSWSRMPTIRLIGAIEVYCYQTNTPYTFQTPKDVKGFCTDEKLKFWNLYYRGKPHANDAIRHAIFFYLHGRMPQALPVSKRKSEFSPRQ